MEDKKPEASDHGEKEETVNSDGESGDQEENEPESVSLTLDELPEKEKQAKQLLKENQIEEAANLFSAILETRVKAFGPEAQECALSYFRYGAALLDQGRAESDVLGKKLLLKQGAKKLEEKGLVPPKQRGPLDVFESDDEDDADSDIDPQSADETLDIAHEALEMARSILTKPEANNPLLLAEVHQHLGDFFLEIDNEEQAIAAFREALDVRARAVKPDHRLMAASHFDLGNAFLQAKNNKSALEHFVAAEQIFRILAKRAAENPDATDEEKQDLADTVSDLQVKIEEVSQQPPSIPSPAPPKQELAAPPAASAASPGTSGPVKNLGVVRARVAPTKIAPSSTSGSSDLKRKATDAAAAATAAAADEKRAKSDS